MKSTLVKIVSLSLVFGIHHIAASYEELQNLGDGCTYDFRKKIELQNKNDMRTISPKEAGIYLELKKQRAGMLSSSNSCSSLEVSHDSENLGMDSISCNQLNEKLSPASTAIDHSPLSESIDTLFQSIGSAESIALMHQLNEILRTTTPTFKSLQEKYDELSSRADTPVETLHRLEQRMNNLKTGK